MPRAIALAMVLCLFGAGASAQSAMKPTAPQKMMSPEEAKKMQACKKQAADQNVQDGPARQVRHGLHDGEGGIDVGQSQS